MHIIYQESAIIAAAILLQLARYINLDKFESRLFDETDILVRLVSFSIVAHHEEPIYCCLNWL